MPSPGAPAPQIAAVHQDEILTGEAVALDVQPVGYFLRALGVLIDMVAAVILFLALLFAAGWMLGQNILDGAVIPIVSIVLAVLVMVVLPTAVETVTRGRSLGRLAVGARIVRADGGASGFRQAFIRALVGVFELWFTLGAVAAIVGAFTPRSQRLGDLLAGTYSERTRTPPLPEYAPGVPPALVAWATVADVARLPDRLSRRITQFSQNASAMQPHARQRLAVSLAEEASAYVSPVPVADPESFLVALTTVRRERELRGLALETDRVARLASGVADVPRGFPER